MDHLFFACICSWPIPTMLLPPHNLSNHTGRFLASLPEMQPLSTPYTYGLHPNANAVCMDLGTPFLTWSPQPPSDPDGIIDMEVLQQIRDMDDEEEDDDDPEAEPHGFSRGIVYGYFDQAKSTFADMEKHM